MKLNLGEWANNGRGISLLLVASAFAIYQGYKEYNHRSDIAFVNGHPFSAARIKEVWVVHKRRGGSDKWARVSFIANIHGKEINCEAEVHVGNGDDYYQAGDRIKVTPRLDTCSNPLVPNIVLKNGTGF